jgi:2-oxo-4-hydroxy-4-carboxy--5-ureidoimidazoline (OHCU) decarboxylase
MNLPEPNELKCLNNKHLVAVLDNLFEPCRTLTDYLIPKIKGNLFETYTELIEFCRIKLLNLIENFDNSVEIRNKICEIVSAHPRLGVPKQQAGKLSEHSQNEQKSLNEDNPNDELAIKLGNLNETYELTFPGLIFVDFVNGRSRDEIMLIMNDRIKNSNWNNEVKLAFNSMCDIALDRAKKLNAKL